MAHQRLNTSWHAARQSSWSYTIALQRHLLEYDLAVAGAASSLGMRWHVDAQLNPARLLRYSTDGRAAGHDPGATPDRLVHSASVVLLI